MDKDKLFKAPRWTTYQPVQVLNINVKPTEEDKKNVVEFRQFINKTIENKKKKTQNQNSVFPATILRVVKCFNTI